MRGLRFNPQLLRAAYGVVAILFSLTFLYAAWQGGLDLFLQRSLFVLFALVLIFLRPLAEGKPPRPLDLLLAVLTVISIGYIALFYEQIAYQAGIARGGQLLLAAIAVLLVLEASRRLLGLALPILVLLFIAYAFLGRYIPGGWGHAGFSLADILGYLYTTPDGLWSLPVGVASTYILIFILLGVFLLNSGVSDLFNALAMRVAGTVRGGPAQVAVIASMAFGTVSGSAPANVATSGSVTIPLMKRFGFPPAFAAGVELAASAGGQLMPPVMGAAAFIMAELLQIPYSKIVIAAIIPAILYYLGVGSSVYFGSGTLGMRGYSRRELAEALGSLGETVKTRIYLLIPLVLLVTLIMRGWYPPRAALYTIGATILVSLLRPETRLGLRRILSSLQKGSELTLEAAMGTACSALIYSMIVFTGIGVKFSTLVVHLASGNILALLGLVALADLILGLSLPTTASYLIAAATLAPALEKVGIPPLAAHLFLFYYAVLATITPPEGMALFTASGIAGAPWMQTGLVGMRLTLSGYLVPFAFVFMPQLLLQGDFLAILERVLAVAIGVIFLSAGIMGYLFRPLAILERAVALIGASLLFHPAWITSAIGALAVAGLAMYNRRPVLQARGGFNHPPSSPRES
ncbi:MAG: TRAP transporter fused permease subunit [Armatimonadota bacterium]|nr:TRAP transporter fused permease subunit [Armatimonadota bacterium]MDR5703278.1 TRAP transporter fused permease subunit [Armatimonadota bacterium]MDR7435280.1 TRAP transporter fused permease subunit [Armatimonadota bacterium]